MSSFRLNPQKLQDIAQISSVKGEAYQSLEAKIQDLGNLINPNTLYEVIGEIFGPNFGAPLFRFLIGLASYSSVYEDENFKVIMEDLTDELKLDTAWYEQNGASWEGVKKHLENILYLPAISLVAKTIDISSHYGDVVSDISITTDMRPVFDNKRNEMVGSILTNTLFIEITDTNGLKKEVCTIHLDDLMKLQKEVERAIQKIDVMKGSLHKITGGNYYIPGESQE